MAKHYIDKGITLHAKYERLIKEITADDKIAIVNAGGGSKGSYQIGVNKKIHDSLPHPPHLYVGTSTGANNAVGMAFNGVNHTVDVWRNIKGRSDIFKEASKWQIAANVLFGKELDGLNDPTPLYNMVLNNIQNRVLQTEAIITKVSMRDGSLHYVTASEAKSKEELAMNVVSSSAVPAHTNLVDYNWADGGVREITPLKKAIRFGCNVIFVVLTNPWVENPIKEMDIAKLPKRLRLLKIVLRAIEILAHEVFLGDLRECIKCNSDPTKKKIRLCVFAPSQPLHDSDEFDPSVLNDAIDKGLNETPIRIDGLD